MTIIPDEKSDHKLKQTNLKPIKIEFLKISYDRIFTKNAEDYVAEHPEVNFNDALDITRPKSDQEYLDTITFHC